MRQLTFNGFLRQYVKGLSFSNTTNIRLLAEEVPEGNYRLVEPLVLYALSIDKSEYLRRIAKDSLLITEAFRFDGMTISNVAYLLECELKNETVIVPYNYIKVYQSYNYYKDKQKHQNHTKTLIRDRINELIQQKHISVYRVYTDLELNQGCVHAYIKNGNVKGIGLNTARQILEYLKAV